MVVRCCRIVGKRDGLKIRIHVKQIGYPKQIAPVHRIFTPGEAEVTFAERVVAAFAEAEAAGSAAIQLDGKFIDYPIVYRAERLLKTLAAIHARDHRHQAAE